MKANFSTKYVYLHDENTKVHDKNKNRCNPVYIMGEGEGIQRFFAKNEQVTNILQRLWEMKPKQSCIIGCQIILTPT